MSRRSAEPLASIDTPVKITKIAEKDRDAIIAKHVKRAKRRSKYQAKLKRRYERLPLCHECWSEAGGTGNKRFRLLARPSDACAACGTGSR